MSHVAASFLSQFQRQQSQSQSQSLCCLVVDSGYSFTHIIPYYKGKKITDGVRRSVLSHHSSKHGCFKCSKVLFFNSSIKSINLIINKSQVINDINKYYLYFNVCNHFFILVGLIFLLNNKLI